MVVRSQEELMRLCERLVRLNPTKYDFVGSAEDSDGIYLYNHIHTPNRGSETLLQTLHFIDGVVHYTGNLAYGREEDFDSYIEEDWIRVEYYNNYALDPLRPTPEEVALFELEHNHTPHVYPIYG